MLQSDIKKLPNAPGVYLMKDSKGTLIYVGKATSLKDRVRSYFVVKPQASRMIEDAIHEVTKVDYIQTPSLLEAVILEANLIKQHQPRYNVKDKDQKSFLYVVITKEEFPKVTLVRGSELMSLCNDKLAVFGPFPSSSSIRTALDILRKIFHWSNCTSPLSPPFKGGERGGKPCFYRRLGRCPGICTGEILAEDYKRTVIKPLILFFQGKTQRVLKGFETRMKAAAKAQNFEEAARLRNQLFSLQHVNDVALVQREEINPSFTSPYNKGRMGGVIIDIFGRIEGYDISNISGTNSVASMVVFQGGTPEKSEYRKFIIKTVQGSDDVGMMREAISRRLGNDWPKPNLILVDGGRGQVNVAEEVLGERHIRIPVLGLAKGFGRKNDHFVYGMNLTPRQRQELERFTSMYTTIFKQVRDEAHRFAVKFHRQRREKMIA